MSLFQAIKNLLKRIFPPPVKSFMREIQALKDQLAELGRGNTMLLDELAFLHEENGKQLSELSQLHSENAKLLSEFSQLRSENAKLLSEVSQALAENAKLLGEVTQNQKESCKLITEGFTAQRAVSDTLQKTADVVRKSSAESLRQASEAVWGEVFNNSIADCEWLTNRTFSPGRWALGYQAMYALFRVLNNVRPEHILELGLGQSTRLTGQYVASNPEAEHYVVEHDPEWISFFQREFALSDRTQVVQLDREFRGYKEAEAVRVFSNFKEAFQDKRFDLILIDAPLGGDMPKYARIDILELLPDCLSEQFVIMMDDVERSGERNTCKEIIAALEKAEIPYAKGYYYGVKSMMLICSEDISFLTTM